LAWVSKPPNAIFTATTGHPRGDDASRQIELAAEQALPHIFLGRRRRGLQLGAQRRSSGVHLASHL
jgi:hypothetical protein